MATCPGCSEELDDGLRFLDAKGRPTEIQASAGWKTCPLCSKRAGVHIFLRFPGDFGTSGKRKTPNNTAGAQSECYACRNRGQAPDQHWVCGGGAAAHGAPPRRPIAKAPSEPHEPKPTAEHLDALLSMLVGPIELTEEGRRMLHVHIGAERSRKNRQAILALHRSRGPIACEACLKVIATVYGADHAEVVDVHHLRPLAHGVQSPSPSDFAVLCPTCHRVVHFRREEPMPLSELRKVLAAR